MIARALALSNHVHPFATADDRDLDLLNRCYEAACQDLQSNYEIELAALADLIAPLTNALVDLYAAGQRDEQALTQYAVSRGLIASAFLQKWRSST